jgi:hypothetical protein
MRHEKANLFRKRFVSERGSPRGGSVIALGRTILTF